MKINVSEKIVKQILDLSNKYSEVHDKIVDLQHEIQGLSTKRDFLSGQLNDYRLEEKELINKLEEETGLTITPDVLNNILNENAKE